MCFNIKQINNLCTGVKLATELKSSSPNLRKFLTVHGYGYDNAKKRVKLNKVINNSSLCNIYFELHCYEISNDYYTNHWDVVEVNLLNAKYIDDINGIEALEHELKKYLVDVSDLEPEWNCDNLI